LPATIFEPCISEDYDGRQTKFSKVKSAEDAGVSSIFKRFAC